MAGNPLNVTQQAALAVKLPPPVGAIGDATGNIGIIIGTDVRTTTTVSPTGSTMAVPQVLSIVAPQDVKDMMRATNVPITKIKILPLFDYVQANPGKTPAFYKTTYEAEIVKFVKANSISTIYFIGHRGETVNEGGFSAYTEVSATTNNGKVKILDAEITDGVVTNASDGFLGLIRAEMVAKGFKSSGLNIVTCGDNSNVNTENGNLARQRFANKLGATVAGSVEKNYPIKFADQNLNNKYEPPGDKKGTVLGAPFGSFAKDADGKVVQKRWQFVPVAPQGTNAIGTESATINQ